MSKKRKKGSTTGSLPAQSSKSRTKLPAQKPAASAVADADNKPVEESQLNGGAQTTVGKDGVQPDIATSSSTQPAVSEGASGNGSAQSEAVAATPPPGPSGGSELPPDFVWKKPVDYFSMSASACAESPVASQSTANGKQDYRTPVDYFRASGASENKAAPGQTAMQSGETAPAQPGETAPAQPRKTAPAQPGETAPAQPREAAPAQPGETASAQPGNTALSQPAETTCTQPGETAPAQPREAAPAQPGETAPAQPRETAPAQPAEAAPAQPRETAPAQPRDTAPAQPGETASAQPGETASAQPAEAAPAQPGETASAQPGDGSPVAAGRQPAPGATPSNPQMQAGSASATEYFSSFEEAFFQTAAQAGTAPVPAPEPKVTPSPPGVSERAAAINAAFANLGSKSAANHGVRDEQSQQPVADGLQKAGSESASTQPAAKSPKQWTASKNLGPETKPADKLNTASDVEQDNWRMEAFQPRGKLVDPKTIPSAPVSERSSKFIENMRQSLGNAGTTETAGSKEKKPQAQESGQWLPVMEQHEDDDNVIAPQRSDSGRQDSQSMNVPDVSARKKKRSIEPSMSLEDRLIQENIMPTDLTEDQLSIRRLKDRTTTGHYPLYLAIFAAFILLGAVWDHFAPSDGRTITLDAGKAIISSVNRVMPAGAAATFSNGLRLYEDEEQRATGQHHMPLEAAIKVGSGEATAGSHKKSWYMGPAGWFLGLPAAALYTVHMLYETNSANSSGFEVVMISFTYVAMLILGLIMYMKTRHRAAVLMGFLTPSLYLICVFIASTIVWAMLSTSSSVFKIWMPSCATFFTACAIITISFLMLYNSFFARKKRHVDPRLRMQPGS